MIYRIQLNLYRMQENNTEHTENCAEHDKKSIYYVQNLQNATNLYRMQEKQYRTP